MEKVLMSPHRMPGTSNGSHGGMSGQLLRAFPVLVEVLAYQLCLSCYNVNRIWCGELMVHSTLTTFFLLIHERKHNNIGRKKHGMRTYCLPEVFKEAEGNRLVYLCP